jgi:hypothetical protein
MYVKVRYKIFQAQFHEDMELSGQIHAPAALPLAKELAIPIGEGTGWTPEQV